MSEPLISTGSPKTAVYTGVSQLHQQFSNRINQSAQQTGAMPHYGGGAEKCARCSKSVYLAEKKMGAGRSFHSSCFSCQTCNRKLDATTLSEHKGEIFCKTCYTRQFGMHGLVSGVTMTTENPAREVRHTRRSSYGSDLDAPVMTHQQARPRAHSNDNLLRGETSAVNHDEVPKLFPWRNDVLPEQIPSSAKKGVEELVEKQPSRPKSQIGFEKVIESTYAEESYSSGNVKSPYANGTSALIDMPVISPVKRTDSHIIERMEMPTVPTRIDQQRSRSPSPTSRDVFQNKIGLERQSDISENFSRLTLSEINNELYGNENSVTKRIASENPVVKPTYSHSTSRDTVNRSRDSSPIEKTNSNRSPSPTSGYGSSSTYGKGLSRDSTSSPPSAFVPQHDYLNARSSNSNGIDRQASSPSKINHLPSPTIGGKYSTIAALIKPHRPVSQLSTSNDNEFDN